MGSSQPPPAPAPPPSSPYTSYPIVVIAIFGILTTAIVLVSYYVFVIKCCMNRRHPDIIGRLSVYLPRRHRRHRHPAIYATSTAEARGLGESAIRAIPIFLFRGREKRFVGGKGFPRDCAICLCEFEEEERLRLLPGCAHGFHIDCIDTWLQTNANCPICRSDIARAEHVLLPPVSIGHFLHGRDTAIDVRDDAVSPEVIPPRTELSVPATTAEQQVPPPAPRELPGQRLLLQGKLQHVSSMRDECIDVRQKDERFHPLQPMRRSISVDSSSDRKLYMAIQEILRRQNPQFKDVEGSGGGGGGGSRFRRSLFSLGYGRSSRNAVPPIHFDS